MHLADLREALRIKTSYPERGATGTVRLNKALNYALRHIWGEMPEALLKEQTRFMLELPVSVSTVRIHMDDRFTWILTATTSQLATNGTLNARSFEVQKNGVWVQHRSREVRRDVVVVDDPLKPETRDIIIVDKPWTNNTDVNMPYRIYTDAYPYPGDVQKVRSIVMRPESEPQELPLSVHPEEMTRIRLGYGWRNQGRIELAASGEFFQLVPPHYTPTLSVAGDQPNPLRWGYDATGVERGAAFVGRRYGAAGTFSYIVCHGWGRLPGQFIGVVDPDTNPDVLGEQAGRLAPFYISGPSIASAQATTTWGGGCIQIALPDIGYQHSSTNNATMPSYRRAGIEKWIFRARHATQGVAAGNNAHVTALEADGVYYLWKVVDGTTTTALDKGDGDPVERSYPLKDFHGHMHIRFDKAPVAADPVLLSVVRRPPTLSYDTDIPHIPPECTDALTELAAAYLLGDRDGALDRKNAYYLTYQTYMNTLRRNYNFPGFSKGSFGDGLSPQRQGMFIGGPIRSP